MANNNHGRNNENEISKAINGKKYKDINSTNLKFFIKEMHPKVTDDTFIQCPYQAGMKKEDLQILIEKKTYNVSVKEGNGNSIHQEKLEPFIKMLKEKFSISDRLADDIRMFIWGDGTTDGSAPKEKRMNNDDFKKAHPEIIERIQKFLDGQSIELLYRFLVTGTLGGNVDYIYYGTPLDGVWCTAENAIEYQTHASKGARTALALGDISFQAWNRCIKGIAKEKQRDTIQLKWGAIQKDIVAIRRAKIALNMGTHEGDSGEFNFTRELNRNKKTSNCNWKFLIEKLELTGTLDNIYAVKVLNKVKSKLIGKKVLPKTDLYLIRADIDTQLLFLNNHLLDEHTISNIKYEVINGSGISVKRPDSTKYTIQKLSPSSFNALFKNTYLAAGASLYCNEKELEKNTDVLAGWGSTLKELIENIPNMPVINILSSSIPIQERVQACQKIKTICNTQIKKIIVSQTSISDLIFKGKGNFNEPYIANFIYKNQKLQINEVTDFSVTTGSGRSHGNYTIEIKPK